jgi:membrane protein
MTPKSGGIIEFLKHIEKFLTRDIWRLDFSQLSKLQAFFYRQIRIGYLVVRAFVQDRLMVRASALVYATLLSIVPLLAVMFSLLKAFEVHYKLGDMLEKVLRQPLGDKAVDTIVPEIERFVDNASGGAVGGVGLVLLFLAVLSIINNVERAFNDIWKVQRTRSLHRRFADYVSILLVGPVLVVVILGLTASLQSNSFVQFIQEIPGVRYLFTKGAPYVISWTVFLFAYLFVPNTRVRFISGLSGGVVAGTLWQIINWVFANFVVTSYQSGSRAALYAGFATLPLFLLWLYISWAVVLLGAEVAYAHQNVGTFMWEEKKGPYSFAYREALALKMMMVIGKRFYTGKTGPTTSELARQFGAPARLINELLSELKSTRLVNEISDEESTYVPGRDLDTMTIITLLNILRKHGMASTGGEKTTEIDKIVVSLQEEVEKSTAATVGEQTIRDLILNSMSEKKGSSKK